MLKINKLRHPAWQWVMDLGLLLIVVATAMPILLIEGNAFRYIYTAGAALALIGRLLTPSYQGDNLRARRLSRLQVWSTLTFAIGAFFIWYSPTAARDWLAFTLAGGILQIYSTLMLARATAPNAKTPKK